MIPVLTAGLFFASGCEDDPILDEGPAETETGGSYGKLHPAGYSPYETDSLLSETPKNPEVF